MTTLYCHATPRSHPCGTEPHTSARPMRAAGKRTALNKGLLVNGNGYFHSCSRAPRFLWTAFCEQENELCPRENSTRLGPRREPGGRPERPQPCRRSSARGGGRRGGKYPSSIEWLKGESLEGLSRRHGVTAATLSPWRGEFLAGGEARLKHRETPIEDEDTRRLKSVVADLATDKALLVEKIRHLEAGRPVGWWRSKRCVTRLRPPPSSRTGSPASPAYGRCRAPRCRPGEIDGITPRPRRSAGRRRRGPMRC